MKVFDMGRNQSQMDPALPIQNHRKFSDRMRFEVRVVNWLPANTWLMVSGPVNEERLKEIANGK